MKNAFLFLFFITACGNLLAQKPSNNYTLAELKVRFKHENYTEKVLLAFQSTMENLREKPQLYENIPGIAISWYTLHGRFSWNKTYLVQENTVKEVETIPKDEVFLEKLNSFVPEKSKFSYSSDLWSFAVLSEKRKDNFYLLKVRVKSFNSYPEMPNDDILLYELEYKTKDFIQFYLVRLKDIHTEKWIEVPE